MRVSIEAASERRSDEWLSAARRSSGLHSPWVTAPQTRTALRDTLKRLEQSQYLSYFVISPENELAGVINANEIVRGAFQSAYLGYYALLPHARQGYMTEGLALVLTELFRSHRLHRVEANIQPGNLRSLALVRRLGFRFEGVAKRYLKIRGRWRDHQHWALLAEEWRPGRLVF